METVDSKYRSVVAGNLDDLPTLNSRLVRIFISSTFTDTREERNLLLEDVYPRLKAHCKERYGMDFQLVDMRWGVPLEAADDHLATALCLQEIRNCQKLSTGPNFVTFLNQKHGYRPLQATIPAGEFELLTSCLRDHGKDMSLVETWYIRDENEAPRFYVLQPISSLIPGYGDKNHNSTKSQWDDVFHKLREDLRFAAVKCLEKGGITEQQKHKYFMSVTEDEIFNGILKLPENAAEHCLCFVRMIEDITDHLDHQKAWRFIDLVSQDARVIDSEAQAILSQLRDEKVVKKLENINITRATVNWSDHDGINREEHESYLEQFAASFYSSTVSLIDKAVNKEQRLSQDDLYIEVLQHLTMARERCELFHGREEILGDIAKYMASENSEPLVLFGQSGCGKTSIMAQTAKMVPEMMKHQPFVILRFLGTSPDSSNLWRLLRSLCDQIAVCYNQDRKQVPEEFDSLKDFFVEQLKLASKENPLVILLDSLDQLSAEHNALKLKWLPRKLPQNVRLVVSTYTEASSLIQTLQSMFKKSNFISVPVFSSDLSIKVLRSWLQKQNRSLTKEQFAIVENAFLQCTLPLYVKLIFDRVLAWRSYLPVSQCSLAFTVQESIQNLFSQLEKKHGQILVCRALAYLTASKTGISETELEDLLSLDDVVLTSVFQVHVPPLRRIPPLLWVRVRHDISQYLVDKEVDEIRAFFWYHRQFYETAQTRYLSDRPFHLEIHSLMADYYIGKWFEVPKPFKYTPEQMKRVGVTSPDGEADRKVSAQPLIFSEMAGNGVRYNKRKLHRFPYHLFKAKRDVELRNICLYNYNWLQTKLKATSIQQLLLDYVLYGERDSILHKAFKAAQSTLTQFPETLSLEISGRLLALLETGNMIKKEQMRLLEDAMQASSKKIQLVPYQPCYNISSESLLYTIEHHRVPFGSKMVAISNDSAHLAALSNDNEVLIWDLPTGEMETTTKLATPNKEDLNVMIKPKGKDVLVLGTTNQRKENPVFIVDINTGSLIRQLFLQSRCTTLGFTEDLLYEITKNTLLVMARGQSADAFNQETGEVIHEFEIKPDQMELLDDQMVIFHPKQSNVYLIYELGNFELVHQISTSDTPKSLHTSTASTIGCVLLADTPKIQLYDLNPTSVTLGKCVGRIDLSRFTQFKIQSAQIYSDLCLVTTMSGFFLWNIKRNKIEFEFAIPENVKPSHRVLEFQGDLTPDGSTVVAGYERHIVLWDAESGQLIHTTETARGRIVKFLLTPSGEHVIITSARNNSIVTWKLSSMVRKVQEYKPLALRDSVRYLAVNKDGTVAVVRSMASNEVAVIDLTLGVIRCNIVIDESMPPQISEDGKYAILRGYNAEEALSIWDTISGELVKKLPISSLNLKGYVQGTQPDKMAVLTVNDVTGEHRLTIYTLPGCEARTTIQLPKYNMMRIFFAKNDEYCVLSIEEGTANGVKAYARAYRVDNGELVRVYEKMHPKLIQRLMPESDCFVGQDIFVNDAGKEAWELVVVNIETGEIISACHDPPASVLSLGAVGRYGIDKNRFVYDIQKGERCFQFDSDSDYSGVEPGAITLPKLTHDEKYAVWLQISHNLLKIGNMQSRAVIAVCPIHSMPLNIEVTPRNIILIGCEDSRLMMMQLLDNSKSQSNDMIFSQIFNRSKRKMVQVRQSVMKTLHRQNTTEVMINVTDQHDTCKKEKAKSSTCMLV